MISDITALGFFRRPEMLAVVDVEAHQAAVSLGGGDKLDGRLAAGWRKARKNAVGIGQPRALEDFVPIEIARRDRAGGAALAVVDHGAGSGRCAEFDVIDAQPRAGNELDVRGVDPATHIVILRQQSQRIVGQFRDEGRFQSQPGDVAGHVALRSAHMNVERPRAADPLVTRRRQPQHALSHGNHVVHEDTSCASIVIRLTFRRQLEIS